MENKRLEKYSERFNNKDNELVEGIFDPSNWGKRMVSDEIDGLEMGQIIPKEYPGKHDETQVKKVLQLAKELSPEDIFNDEKRVGIKRIINQHKVLKGLSLINPLHLQMTESGYGEFPDSYKLTEKGIQYIIEKLNKE